MNLSYNRRCHSMAISLSNMTPAVLRTPHTSLQPIRTRSVACRVWIETRVLDRNATKELIPWHAI